MFLLIRFLCDHHSRVEHWCVTDCGSISPAQQSESKLALVHHGRTNQHGPFSDELWQLIHLYYGRRDQGCRGIANNREYSGSVQKKSVSGRQRTAEACLNFQPICPLLPGHCGIPPDSLVFHPSIFWVSQFGQGNVSAADRPQLYSSGTRYDCCARKLVSPHAHL